MKIIYKLFKKIFFRRIVEDIERAVCSYSPESIDVRSVSGTNTFTFWQDFINELKR